MNTKVWYLPYFTSRVSTLLEWFLNILECQCTYGIYGSYYAPTGVFTNGVVKLDFTTIVMTS